LACAWSETTLITAYLDMVEHRAAHQSGGAIYNDGDTYTLTVDGSVISGNSAREGGGAIFYVSNDRTGTMQIEHSQLRGNPNAGFQTSGFPGIFFLGRGQPALTSTTDS
jgi:hypothetical protein